MKKLFLLFATLLGSVGVSAYDFEDNGIQYTITSYDNHEVVITGRSGFSGENWDFSQEVYNGNNSTYWHVKRIEASVFSNCSSLKTITIPVGISIGEYAFQYCENLEKIIIAKDLWYYYSGDLIFEYYSFFGCNKLKEILCSSLDDSSSWSGETIEFRNQSFRDCASLQQLIIPDKVTCSYYSCAFAGCSQIKRIELGKIKYFESSSSWNAGVFDCTNLEYIKSSNDVYWNYYNDGYQCPEGSNAVVYGKKGTGGSFVPKSLLFGCKNTIISDGVETIEYGAFAGCIGLASINIPSSVTSIGSSAFSGCTGLTSITVEAGNTKYDSRNDCNAIIETGSNTLLYGCMNTIIPNDVTAIGASAFQNCSGLTSINIPSSVVSIGNSAYSGCVNLSSITVESGNTTYDSRNDCNALIETNSNKLLYGCKNTVIPNTVTTIANQAFYGCSGLTSFSIPNNVTSIGNDAFSGCTGLQTLTIGISSIGSWFSGNKSLTTVTLTEDVTSIGNSAFSGCTNLASINIPSSITSIGTNAFNNCISLPSITMGNTIPTAGNGFLDGTIMIVYVPSGKLSDYKTAEGWSNYASSILAIGTQTVYDINVTAKNDDSDIHSVIGETNLKNVTDLTLTGSVNSYDVMIMRDKMPNLRKLDLTNANIVANSYEYMDGRHTENNAFLYGMRPSTVRELKLPLSLKKIDEGAFSSVSSLKELVIPNGVEEIGKNAFYNCDLITSIPKSVVSIGESAFRECDGLTELDFSNSQITTIGKTAFYGCKNIQTIDFSNSSINSIASEQYSGGGVFGGCDALTTLNFSNCTNLATIGTYAFNNCTSLLSVDMSNSKIGSIGDLAFRNCTALKTVSFENSEVNTIGGAAFSVGYSKNYYNYYSPSYSEGTYCLDSLQSLKIKGAKINAIGFVAFYNCSHLDVDFSEAEIGEIRDYAFANTVIKQLVISNPNITTIGARAFYDCDSLRTVNLSNSELNTIGQYAFSGCNSLKDVNISGSKIETIGSDAFSYCNSLNAINLSNSKITTISSSAFYQCNSLKNVNLSNCQNLTSIESSAFYNCNKLEEIQIPGSVKTIGNSAFNCNSITDVYAKTIIPRTITINTFSNNTMKNGTLHVPALSYKNYYWATNWSQFATIVEDANPDYFFIDDDLTVESGKATGDAVDADINTVGGMVVEDDNQAFNEVSVENNGSTSGSFIPSNNTTINIINLNITVTANKWQFLSFPYRVKLTDVVAPGFYVFRRYDGAQRASTGGTGWASLAQETEYLEPGVGYIFQSSQSGTLGIRSENPDLSWGSGKTNPLSVYTTDNIQHASWNFVGNPLLCYYDIDDLHTTAPLTFWNGSSYVARRPGDDNYQLRPFEAFFLQKPDGLEQLTYDKSGRMTYKQAQEHHNNKNNNARAAERSQRFLINLSLMQGQWEDEARVVYNNKKTTAYEPDCDAAKFMSTMSVPQLYAIEGNVQMAIDERPWGEVQLGFIATAEGEHTITATRLGTNVLLRDNLLNITHDLSLGGYTFTTEAGTFNDRFTLVPEAETTGIGATLNEKGQMMNDKAVFDLQGRRTTDAAQKGVRIVRKNHETRKIVK